MENIEDLELEPVAEETDFQPETEPEEEAPVCEEPTEEVLIEEELEELDPEEFEKYLKKRRLGKILAVIGSVLISAVMICIACVLSIYLTSKAWEQKYAVLNSTYTEKYALLNETANNRINALKEQLDEALENQAPSVPSGEAEQETDGLTPAQVYERNVQAVVAINSQGVTTNFYGQSSSTASSGSGFILSADGYVVTNYHVVQGGTTLTVITHDSTEYDAQLVGYDSTNDVAVLKVDAQDLPYVSIGSSDALFVGDRVAAIGNPLGELTSTMTVGYVSAKDRMVTTDGTTTNMLQTDCAINSGNSGGPLFNMNGKVVGITTAKYSGYSNSGTSIEGIGFAIPIDDVMEIINDLRDYGYVKSAYLGVYVRDIDSSVAQLYGLPSGVYVESTEEGYCAAEAGIQAGDILINLGGYDVANMSDLSRALRKFEAGEQTTVTVLRNGAEVNLRITLDDKPVETETPEVQPEAVMPENGDYDEWFEYFFG